jgi:hypothetical protein
MIAAQIEVMQRCADLLLGHFALAKYGDSLDVNTADIAAFDNISSGPTSCVWENAKASSTEASMIASAARCILTALRLQVCDRIRARVQISGQPVKHAFQCFRRASDHDLTILRFDIHRVARIQAQLAPHLNWYFKRPSTVTLARCRLVHRTPDPPDAEAQHTRGLAQLRARAFQSRPP